mmetsp:Transcript_26489/g.36473  ORF Transcript_26489/g.36473 Transcript_26489/m.36473 type:complete len:761 (+) Transcript_26489:177-2459(+)
MSKTDKMRGKLLSVQKDREEFEKQKKQLEEQMNIGKQNIGRIQKGLKNNDINKETIVIEQQTASFGSPDAHSKQGKTVSMKNSGFSKSTMSMKSVSDNSSSMNSPQPVITETLPSIQTQISSVGFIPLGTRISDWCYTGSLDSAPPVVKSDELYDMVRHIGRGSYGDVNLVKNTEDNKLFAIKSMFCPKESDYHCVLREVRYLRAHRHPCIIDVVDAFVISNPRVVHIVMPYCESGNLSTVIATAKKSGGTAPAMLPESQIMKWMLQLCLALQFLHDNSILHRDIKPMNIMLTEGGDLLKLGDFGLALDMKKSRSSELVDEAGTPYYTAPEMILREQYSFPADCWSIGVVLYQLLALERPFDGDSAGNLVKSILNEEPTPLPSYYSEEIRKVCRELLQKNQMERITMNKLLIEPCFYSKTVQFATSYRPKTLDDRSRRVHIKQLETQVELLMREMRLKQQYQQQQLIERQQHLQQQLSLNPSFNPNPNPLTHTNSSSSSSSNTTSNTTTTHSPAPPTSSLSSANLLANNAVNNAVNTTTNPVSNAVNNAVLPVTSSITASSLAANTLANKGVAFPTMASFKAALGTSTKKLQRMGSSTSMFSSSDVGSFDYNDDDGYFDEAMNPFESEAFLNFQQTHMTVQVYNDENGVHFALNGQIAEIPDDCTPQFFTAPDGFIYSVIGNTRVPPPFNLSDDTAGLEEEESKSAGNGLMDSGVAVTDESTNTSQSNFNSNGILGGRKGLEIAKVKQNDIYFEATLQET